MGFQPLGIAFDGADLWIANRGDSTVSKLRASDGLLLGTFKAPGNPYGVAFDGVHIWVTGAPYVSELQASDGSQVGLFDFPANSTGVAFDGTNIWVTQFKLNAVGKVPGKLG